MSRRVVAVALVGMAAVAWACGSSTEEKTVIDPPTSAATKAPPTPEPDAGEAPKDAGGDAATCPPPSVDPARLLAFRGSRAKGGMCTSQAMLEGTVDACVKGLGSCDTWLDDLPNLDCQECLVGNATDAAWAALIVVDGKRSFGNRGGFVQLSGGSAACAKATHDVEACVLEACTCKVGSSVCDKNARAGACKGYVAARDAACSSSTDKAILASLDTNAYAFYAPFCPP